MMTSIDTPWTLLRRRVQIALPNYQRPYAWEEEQLQGFWSGLTATVMESDETLQTYFLGPILLAEKRVSVTAPQQWLVVDGGQRLISIMVLICAIRDYLVAETAAQYGEITNDLLVNPHEESEFRYKLMATAGDQEALLACIEGGHDFEVDHRIIKARDFFRKRLSESGNVNRILESLLHRTELARVVADERTLSSLYSLEPAHFRNMIQQDESARDVIAVAGRRRTLRRFRRLLEDDEYFEHEMADMPQHHGFKGMLVRVSL